MNVAINVNMSMVFQQPIFRQVYFREEYEQVRLINIEANQKSKPNEYISYFQDSQIVEPNTDYNCLKIGDLLLFIVRKDSIEEYKKLTIDRIPLNKLIDIKNKNIINFIHWALKYDKSKCVFVSAVNYASLAYITARGRASFFGHLLIEHIHYLAHYLLIKLTENSVPNNLQGFIICIGEEVFKNSNLEEQYHKCLSKNIDKKILLGAIHKATIEVHKSINEDLYLKNIARALLYNKVLDLLYKDIENTEQQYVITIELRYSNEIKKLALYSITDNRNSIINFLILLLGHVINVGGAVYIDITNKDPDARIDHTHNLVFEQCAYVVYPIMEYQIDCEKNEVNVLLKEMKMHIDRDKFEIIIEKRWRILGIQNLSEVFSYGHLYDILNGIRAFLKQCHTINNILLKNNAMMFIPLVRTYSIVSERL